MRTSPIALQSPLKPFLGDVTQLTMRALRDILALGETKAAFHWGDLYSRSVWIMLHQRNRGIHDQNGLVSSFDAP